MPGTLSAFDVAERLGVSPSTLKTWTDRLGIGSRNSSGKRLYEDTDISLLELVKSLRETDCGFDTITRRIKPEMSEQDPTLTSSDNRHQSPPTTIEVEDLAEKVSAAVVAAVLADNEQSKRYAVATHRIGELEERCRQLEARCQQVEAENSRLRTILGLPLWRYITQGRRMLTEAISGAALPPGSTTAN